MGGPETAGIVVITVVVIQGLMGLVKYMIAKNDNNKKNLEHNSIMSKLNDIEDNCGMTDDQAFWLHELHKMHARYDSDGTPLWYVPRSWADTQKEIVNQLRIVSEVNMKMLDIIERLERKLEQKQM